MRKPLRVIYWLGIVAIWVVAVFWLIFSAVLYIQDSNSAARYIAGSAFILGLFCHFAWRWVLRQQFSDN
ncbi:MAG: hypothetical protein CL398_08615 [Acidiferrobacteraceae bacterium]|nr:hypothetical protein [Acidiferrobacteraceae bacterium]|tara:strand:+ start:89 stop:295 length:207 start_codon:yes stop_codon:yes gene_type:complete